MRVIKLLPAAALLCAAWLNPFSDEVSAGNSEYKNKNFSAAMEHYKKAESYAADDGERALLNFNRGDVEYSRGNFDKAAEYYDRSAKSGDVQLAKKSYFNMGNAYLKKGKKMEAAQFYAKALELDPEYGKARKNLEYLQKQKNQDSNKKDNSGGSGDKQDKSEKGGGDKNNSGAGTGKGEMTPEQAARIFESMKNRPVRKKKGDRGGRRALEKYW